MQEDNFNIEDYKQDMANCIDFIKQNIMDKLIAREDTDEKEDILHFSYMLQKIVSSSLFMLPKMEYSTPDSIDKLLMIFFQYIEEDLKRLIKHTLNKRIKKQ